MQHLNIPLSKNSQTTRRTRWVVWLLVFSIVCIGAITAWATTLWFTRDTIYTASPEHTVSAARFFVSGTKGKLVESVLSKTPLISNRSLTFSDFAPYLGGEFIIFISEDGSRSIAIRKGMNPLPQTFLDSQSITSQDAGHGIILLSDRQQAIKPTILKPKLLSGISYPGHVWIGEFVETTKNKRSFIYANRKGIEISLNNAKTKSVPFKKIPNNTIAYLSTSALTKDSELSDPLSSLLQFIDDKEVLNSFKQIIDSESQMILTKDNDGVGFFITSDQEDSHNTSTLEQILRSIATLSLPKIQETLLSDGSTIKEIVANPEEISVEQVTILGTQVNRVHTNNGVLLAGSTKLNNFFLTNREDLFRQFKTNSASGSKIFSGNIGGVSFGTLNKTPLEHTNQPINNGMFIFSQSFTGLGIESGVFSTKIKLCH